MSNLDYAAKQLNKIRNRIEQAVAKAGRESASVRLIGASKMQNIDLIKAFTQLGLADLGENYLQEAIDKQQHIDSENIQWHFIGHIQSNKSKLVAENFDWVHGIDRAKVAQRLSRHREDLKPLKTLVQVNIDREASKSGVEIEAAAILCDQIAQLNGLSLEGLMVIPKSSPDPQEQAKSFTAAQTLRDSINQQYGLGMTQLSMGMSSDLETAIAHGSTMVRIGSDLFGARPQS